MGQVKETLALARKPNLHQILETHRGERHVIAIRGFPDPDSIGSAMAHAYICQSYDIDTIILYFDDISHQENRALVKKLAIDMVRYTEKLDLTNYQGLAIVDSQLFTVPAPLDELPVISIVDHHKLQPETQADFLDVREDSGSTCSIYAEYLAEVGPALERENSQCGKLASALLYGIRSDTDDYLRAREIDYRAASFLAPYADHELLLAISMQSISPRTMEITQRAYANKVIADTFLIAGAGFVREEDRDSIGQAADYLLQREGIDTVLCYGVINNHFVDGSLRTTSNVVDPDRFIKDLLGTNPSSGEYYGGGRADKGAFRVDLGLFRHCGNRELLWELTQRTIEDLFFNKIGISRNEGNRSAT